MTDRTIEPEYTLRSDIEHMNCLIRSARERAIIVQDHTLMVLLQTLETVFDDYTDFRFVPPLETQLERSIEVCETAERRGTR